MLANATGSAVVNTGGNTWFFITADYGGQGVGCSPNNAKTERLVNSGVMSCGHALQPDIERPALPGCGSSLVPQKVPGEANMLPGEWRGMGKQLVWDGMVWSPQMLDGVGQVGRIPIDARSCSTLLGTFCEAAVIPASPAA
jgi:hypothetical protein